MLVFNIYKYLVTMMLLENRVVKYASLVLFICFANHFVYSQNTDSSCIKSVRIAVKPTLENDLIFKSTETDLITLISSLVNSNKLTIYKEEKGFELDKKMIPIPEVEYYLDAEKKDTVYSFKKSEYFEIKVPSTSPMINSVGGDSMIFNDGYWAYCYPKFEIGKIEMKDIKEIRIQEIHFMDDKTNSIQFSESKIRASKIGFYTNIWGNEVDFWVDLNELYLALGVNSNYTFITALKNRSYKGFQYSQVPCSD